MSTFFHVLNKERNNHALRVFGEMVKDYEASESYELAAMVKIIIEWIESGIDTGKIFKTLHEKFPGSLYYPFLNDLHNKLTPSFDWFDDVLNNKL